VERHRKVHQNTSAPASFSQILPSGKDLYVAANMSEIAALTGMPEEHQRRTVVIAPRMLKTMQSGMWPCPGTHSHAETTFINPLFFGALVILQANASSPLHVSHAQATRNPTSGT